MSLKAVLAVVVGLILILATICFRHFEWIPETGAMVLGLIGFILLFCGFAD